MDSAVRKICTKTKHGVNLWGAVFFMDDRKYTVTEALRTEIKDGLIWQRWKVVAE